MTNLRTFYLKHLIIFLLVTISIGLSGQNLNSPSATGIGTTSYVSFPSNDPIYFFCGTSGTAGGMLTASIPTGNTTFVWEKYDTGSGNFTFISNQTGASSTISDLSDGCYRIKFSYSGIDYQKRAWVFNTSLTASTSIAESNCQSFKLMNSSIAGSVVYYDLATRQSITYDRQMRYEWKIQDQVISTESNPTIYNPPTQNTPYKLTISDRTGCTATSQVTYESIVTKAKFSWNTTQKTDQQFTSPEAPLDVQFVNESLNGDPDKFEWFLFKEKKQLKREGENGAKVDSFLVRLYAANPTFRYEYSGSYQVKLVSTKESQNFTCRDTFYLEKPIFIDSSLVKVAPVFTPNGDGINDVMTVQTRSLLSLTIEIFNRWGGIVHRFSKDGFIPDDAEMAAWDGKQGGKLLPSGTYFYVISAMGRDGERRRKKGFVQLIW